jgi:hypothetical protein
MSRGALPRLHLTRIYPGRTKKPRMAVLSSDEEQGDVASFGSRLSRFKKSPVKRCVYLAMCSVIRVVFIFISQHVLPAPVPQPMTTISSSLTSLTRNHAVALHLVLLLEGVPRSRHLDVPPAVTARMRTRMSPGQKNRLSNVLPSKGLKILVPLM